MNEPPRSGQAGRAQVLATRAMSLVRSDADPRGAVVVLLGLAGDSGDDLDLARARCRAAVDQDPGDLVAARATLTGEHLAAYVGA